MRIFLILSIFWLCSCDSLLNSATYTSLFSSSADDSLEKISEKSDSKTEEPYILSKSFKDKINLSQLNRSKSVLRLSDQIVFPFISKNKESEFRPFNQIKKEGDFKVKVSSLCSSMVSGKKAVKEFFGLQTKSHFMFLHIIPEEVLVSSEENTFTCSFIFSFKNKDQDVSHYIVTQQPIISSHQDKGLILKNKANKKLSLYSPIEVEDIDFILLVRQDSQLLDKYRFICDDFAEGISFQLKDVKDSFLYHIFSQKKLPKGVRNCRIVSEKFGFVYGMTQLFRVNFDRLGLEGKVLDIGKINYKVINEGNESLTLLKQNFGYAHDIQKSYKNNNYTTAYPFSIIKFSGLPSDFSSSKYNNVQVKVDTVCSGDLFPGVFEKSYKFPLVEEFSLMSITPESIFQLYYNEDQLKSIQHTLSRREGYSRSKNERIKQKPMKCMYGISLENQGSDGQKIVVDIPQSSHILRWSSGSYGVNLSSHVGQESLFLKPAERDSKSLKENGNIISHISLSFIQKEQAGYLNLVFLNQLANENYWDSYPDKMTLKCGDQNYPSAKGLSLNFFSLDRLGSSIPLSLLFAHSSVLDYLNENVAVKCRFLFYRDDVLRYFSSELRVFK